MSEQPYQRIADDVRLDKDVVIRDFVNLYGCQAGDNTRLGAFLEIQNNAKIGRNCKISTHTFICEGVTIEDDVFIWHNGMSINGKFPRATNAAGELPIADDWELLPTGAKRGASIGSGATILGNVMIGEDSVVGAGSVVTRDVPPNTVVAGNLARFLRIISAAI